MDRKYLLHVRAVSGESLVWWQSLQMAFARDADCAGCRAKCSAGVEGPSPPRLPRAVPGWSPSLLHVPSLKELSEAHW